MSKTNEKKKGFFEAIWESMTKTGGCCGGGESCGCGSRPDKDKEKNEKKNENNPPSRAASSETREK